jgi:hypothetical protein
MTKAQRDRITGIGTKSWGLLSKELVESCGAETGGWRGEGKRPDEV